jgi:hypothetical protein
MTLNSLGFETYTTEKLSVPVEEAFDNTAEWHTPVPPLCSACYPVVFPKIGYEGGFKVPSGDEVAQDVFKTKHKQTVYSTSIFGVSGYWYDNVTKKLPADPLLPNCLHSDYMVNYDWIWAEDVSRYYDPRVSFRTPAVEGFSPLGKASITYSKLRFMATFHQEVGAPGSYYYQYFCDNEIFANYDRHDCVWMPTAITIEIPAYVTTPIRKRWYNMIFYKLKFILGYW